MKHVLKGLLLVMVILLVCWASTGMADESSGYYQYTVDSNGKATITKYTGNEMSVKIPSSIDGHVVEAIGERAFYSTDIQVIIMPETVLSIGEYAFGFADNLSSVTTYATTIDKNAFSSCDKLATVDFMSGPVKLKERAFYSCGSLTTINGTIMDPDEYAFGFCDSLESITITGTRIGKNAFSSCEGLKTVVILDSPMIASERAFYSCSGLTTVTGTIKDVGEYAFGFCDNLKSVTLSGKKVSSNAFSSCESLETVTILTPKMTIKDRGFYSCSKLKTIDGILGNIGNYAFGFCDELTSLKVAGTEIDRNAFSGCSSLSIEIPRDNTIENAVAQTGISYTIVDFEIPENPDESESLNPGEVRIEAGEYTIGSEIKPGSYSITMSDISSMSYVVVFENEQKLNTFKSQMTSDSLVENAKLLFFAQDYSTFHLTLHEGECLYFNEGEGLVSPDNSGTIIKGIYYIGEDIIPGTYMMEVSDIESECYIASFESSDKLMTFLANDSISNLMQYSSFATRATEGEPFRISMKQGDILFITDGKCTLVEADKGTITPGIYNVGSDIEPGDYSIELTGIDYSTIVATFANRENLSAYAAWSSADNLKQYGKIALYAKDGKPFHISLEAGDVLYISSGSGTMKKAEDGSVLPGVYKIGNDIKPGSYVFELNGIDYSAIIATFSTSENLVGYVSWDSADNLKQFGKTSLYAKDGKKFHVSLEAGDYLYIAEGSGSYQVAEQGKIYPGVYQIGSDLTPGSYTITLDNDVSYSAIVASFANSRNLMTYTSWDSANNLEQYSKKYFYAKQGQPVEIDLEVGDILFIGEGNGTIILNSSKTTVKTGSEVDTESANVNTDNTSEEWICPQCGNKATGNFCNMCGTQKPISTPEPEATEAPTPTPTTISESNTGKEVSTEKQYTFTQDRWNLYIATEVSETSWKLEKWSRSNAKRDFKFDYEVGTFETSDSSYGFTWADESRCAFFITLNDPRNSDLNQERIGFAISPDNVSDVAQYSFTNDRWAQYKAFALSESVIKVECWGRYNAKTDEFKHYYDIGVFNTNDPSNGFSWLDEAHTAFHITMEDKQNENWKNGTTRVGFSLETEKKPESSQYSFTNDRWAQYKAYVISPSVIKIECWGRYNAKKDEFKHYYDIGVFSTNDTSGEFAWTDDSHTAFFVMMEDKLNESWKRESEKIGFTIDPKSISDVAEYTYTYDKWNLFKAYTLSPNTIKIECWGRYNAKTDDFTHYYDVCTIQVDDPYNDFIWTKDDFTAFSVSVVDYNNDDLNNLTKFDFTLENDQANTSSMATTVPKVTATPVSETPTPTPASSENNEEPTYSSADIRTNGKFQYVVLTGGNAQIIRYTGTDSSISISSSIDGHSIVSIGDGAFKDCTSLKTITIWADIEEFGNEAFMNCSKLKKISIPGSTKKIGKNAFKDCVNLETVTIWGDLDGIRESTFENCKALRKISISSTAKFIDKRAFYGCEKMTTATIWGEPEYIGESAFEGCVSLQKISIPSSTKRIEDYAFKGCSSMSSVIIWGDANIGNYAFQGCSKITKISISSGTEYIGDYAFDGCTNLSKVTMWGRKTNIGTGAFDNCPNLKDAPKSSGTTKTTKEPATATPNKSTPTPAPTPDNTQDSNLESTVITGKTAHLEAGKYIGGDDIPAGKYVLICKTSSRDYGIVWVAKNADESNPSILYTFVDNNTEEKFYINIGEGYVLNCPFACDLAICDTIEFKDGTAHLDEGKYIFGDDLPVGKYILLCEPDRNSYGIVWVAKDTDIINDKNPSILYEFVGQNESKKYYVNAVSQYVLCCPFPCTLIECNTLTFENDSLKLEAGKYVFGDDIPVGKYVLTCQTSSSDYGIVWVAKDTDDLENGNPSVLYDFVGQSSESKYSINVKEGYVLNCPFNCILTKTQGVSFD